MRKIFSCLFALSALALAPSLAHADDPTTLFYIDDGVFFDGGTFSGTFLLDTVNFHVESIAIEVNDPTYSLNDLELTSSEGEFDSYPETAVFLGFGGGADVMGFSFIDSATNPVLCLNEACANAEDGFDTYLELNSGDNFNESVSGYISTSPYGPTPAATPEPASLLLIGTGALGALATLRRRIADR